MVSEKGSDVMVFFSIFLTPLTGALGGVVLSCRSNWGLRRFIPDVGL